MSLENILSSIKKNARRTAVSALTGITLLGSSALYSPQVKAEDITEAKNISLVTQFDNDGDGLINEYENLIGTNPDLEDTDGDKLGDGEEIGNLNADPLNSDSPGFGSANTIYKSRLIKNITSGLDNVVASTWLVGGKIAYVEGDSIYVKNLFDMTEPRKLLVSGLNNEFREISSDPIGSSVYFHINNGKKDVIKKVNVNTGEILDVIPNSLGNISYGIRNPSVSGNLEINKEDVELYVGGNYWLVAETDLPDATKGQVNLYKLVSNKDDKNFGVWDGSKPVGITNCPNKIIRPRISKDGDKIMLQELINDASSTLFLFKGVTGIVNSAKKPYNTTLLSSDLRGGIVESYLNGVAFPGGFGRSGFVYWTHDQNNNFNLKKMDFSESDFNVVGGVAKVQTSGRYSIGTPRPSNIITPGNQPLISISPEGSRFAFLDNYLEDSQGNFNLYRTSVKGAFKIVDGLQADYLNEYVDPSGISLEGNHDSQTLFGGNSLFSISMLDDPIDIVSESEFLTGQREFEPSGLDVKGSTVTGKSYSFPPAVYMKLPWDNSELVNPEGIIDENSISVAWEEVTGPSTTEYIELSENQVLERNLDQNYISFYTEHFSNGTLVGKLLEKVSDVVNWRLMDREGKEESYGVIVGSPTNEFKPYVLELKPWEP